MVINQGCFFITFLYLSCGYLGATLKSSSFGLESTHFTTRATSRQKGDYRSSGHSTISFLEPHAGWVEAQAASALQ
jgi:hypothetical protein